MEWDVVPYTVDQLKRLFEEPGRTMATVECKGQLGYFEEYFGPKGMSAGTILVEAEYIDHDYLEDYSSYYVKCFQDYRKRCRRLHFFRCKFSKPDIERLITGQDSPVSLKLLRDEYLGFIVVKPLPHCMIGRTCLKTYPEKTETGGSTGRHFPATREYEVHLLGVTLTVKSLAFGEQDQVVAACATSALWSAFQATAKAFQHVLPSPVEITKVATASLPIRSRVFPHSDGLSIEQMAQAIREFELEPLCIDVENKPDVLRQCAVAYLENRIPLVLLHELHRPLKPGESSKVKISMPGYTLLGHHAATITGYRLDSKLVGLAGGVDLLSRRVNKLYVHDDQVGPYARMVFHSSDKYNWLSTSWGDTHHQCYRAVPIALLIPLYHKIRLTFDLAVRVAGDLARSLFLALNGHPGGRSLVWKVGLTGGSDFKQDVARRTELTPANKLRVLNKSLPKYIWRVSALDGDRIALDCLLDATDIAGGSYLELLTGDVAELESLKEMWGASPDDVKNPSMKEAVSRAKRVFRRKSASALVLTYSE